MRIKMLLRGLSLAVCLSAAVTVQSAPFKDGDRVVFFGDSITHGGFYGEYVNLFYATRYPERSIWFSNSGWSGASAEQGLWSIEDDVVAKKPTAVTVMFGMNDINRNAWPRTNDTPAFAAMREAAIRTYDTRMDELVRRVRAEAGNPEIIYFTPSPYDQTCLVDGKPSDIVCNDGLAILADHVRSWAAKDKATCVDLQGTMAAINADMQKKDPSASLVRGSPTWFDRVHPGPLGHTVMLYEILKAQDAESCVDEIERDANGADALVFTCTEKSLPFPMTDEMRRALGLVPFEKDFNREILRVRNLKEGRYAVKIDGTKVGVWTAAELSEGVNLALNEKTPQYRQAAEAAKICRRLWSGERMLRDLVTRRRWMRMHYKIDPDAPGAAEGILEKLLADGKSEDSYEVKAYRAYLKDWPRHAELEAAVVKDRAALAEAVRPKEHRFEIVAAASVLGYQLDISRCKVPKMETLYRIVDILAIIGYNQFQLYTEHTFAYTNHETVWREASPMTPEEVRALDAYCAARGIELVPNQNSFGHLEHWLRHPEYNGLANHPQGGARVARWDNCVLERPSTLNPCDPASIALVAGMYDELFPCFRSRYVNVGCDETVELEDADGGGRSADAVREKGAPAVYLDFLKKIYCEVKKRGHVMMFWGDIVLNHPELLPEIPDDVVCLNWGYEKTSPFEERTARLEAAGRRFIVCPGTSAWGSLSGRVENMLGNIDAAVSAGDRHGAEGYLLADWGDKGNPQPWIVSLPALVYLSHKAKGESLSREEIAKEIDGICGCTCGKALLVYGGIYLKCGGRTGNSTELFRALTDGDRYARDAGVTDKTLEAAFAEWHRAQSLLDFDGAPDWVKDDFELLDLLYRAVEVKMKEPRKPNFRAIFEPEYRRLWLRQNRLGGLKDSLVEVFGR